MEGFFSLLCTLPELESVKSIAMLLTTKYYSFLYAKLSKLGVKKSIVMLLTTKYYSFLYAKLSKLGVNPDS
jgi:hypothetical protein